MAFKFYTSMTKRLKLKVRKFLGLVPTFVEVTRGKRVGGTFRTPLIMNRVKVLKIQVSKQKEQVFIHDFH